MTTRRPGQGLIVFCTIVLALAAPPLLQASAVTDGPLEPAVHAPDVAASPDDCESAETPKDQPEADNRSFRSGPPDTTPYLRPLVPEDRAPRGEPAIPPGVAVPAPDESLQTQTENNSKDGGT